MSPMNNRLLVPRKTPGLLDLVPGAAAAYSLRSLSRSYAGPVVTVRRSSDDAEDSFTASEVADGTLASFCGAGNGFAKQWWDQSGNARHASQSTAGSQPQVVNSGVNITQDGYPAISFNGVAQAFTRAALDGDNPFLFVVAADNSTVNYNGSLFRANGSDYPGHCVTITNLWYSNFYTSNQRLVASGVERNVHNIFCIHHTGTQLVASVNGALQTPVTTNKVSATEFTIGANGTSFDFKGTMQEFILYFSDLTAQRELIEGNIAWGWSV